MRLHDIVVQPRSPYTPLADLPRPWMGSDTITHEDLVRVSNELRRNNIPENTFIVHPQTRLYRAIANVAAEPDLRRQTERVYAAYRDQIQREYDRLLDDARRSMRPWDV